MEGGIDRRWVPGSRDPGRSMRRPPFGLSPLRISAGSTGSGTSRITHAALRPSVSAVHTVLERCLGPDGATPAQVDLTDALLLTTL